MKKYGCASSLCEGQGALFLALTFVLVIIIVLMSPDIMTALVIIGLLLGATLTYNMMGDHDVGAYCKCPAPPPPHDLGPPAPLQGYPGAIDINEYDSEPGWGHRDRTERDNEFASEGNPFNFNRLNAPSAAGACIDDEANDDALDGDERMNYQARSRNDPTRATAGTMNRRCDLDKYLREEVEEEDDREWWGRHED